MGSPEYNRTVRAVERAAVLFAYGLSCACCDLDATESYAAWAQMTIDHIAGDGEEHRARVMSPANGWRASGGAKFYRWLIKNGFPSGYQTLCLPCNVSKGSSERCRLEHT